MSQPEHLTLSQRIASFTYKTLKWGRDHVAPGIRSLIGVAFMVGGVFGFLPILGFWMIPLGAAFIMLDIPFMRHKIDDWIERLHHKVHRDQGNALPSRSYPVDPEPPLD